MGHGVADIQDELTHFPFRIDEKSSNVIRVRLGDKLSRRQKFQPTFFAS